MVMPRAYRLPGKALLPRIRANDTDKAFLCSCSGSVSLALIRGKKQLGRGGSVGRATGRCLTIATMKEKEQIVENWLPRYTGVPLDGFGEHILLTNFAGYLGPFARLTGAELAAADRPIPSATPAAHTLHPSTMGRP